MGTNEPGFPLSFAIAVAHRGTASAAVIRTRCTRCTRNLHNSPQGICTGPLYAALMAFPQQRRVLVVEDDETIARAVRHRLAAEGFDVRVAGDGEGALAAYAKAEPDVVILDRLLPGLDGLEVCRRMQAARPVPVLMLTALGEETDLLVGLGVGADDYMTKPFS